MSIKPILSVLVFLFSQTALGQAQEPAFRIPDTVRTCEAQLYTNWAWLMCRGVMIAINSTGSELRNYVLALEKAEKPVSSPLSEQARAFSYIRNRMSEAGFYESCTVTDPSNNIHCLYTRNIQQPQ